MASKAPAKTTAGAKPKTSRARAREPGTGWGGPAKGAGSTKPRTNAPTPGPGRGHYSLAGEARHEREGRIAEEMREFYYGVVTDPEEPTPNKLTAATKLLDRIEGLPVQKVVTQQTDALGRMTDQQLEEAAAETRRRIAAHEAAKKPDV